MDVPHTVCGETKFDMNQESCLSVILLVMVNNTSITEH